MRLTRAVSVPLGDRARTRRVGTLSAFYGGMDWTLVDVDRVQAMRCPSCQRELAGGLMRQVEWTVKRCVVVVVCPNCRAECMAILDARVPTLASHPPIDVDDVRRAHELLASREWRVDELFA